MTGMVVQCHIAVVSTTWKQASLQNTQIKCCE